MAEQHSSNMIGFLLGEIPKGDFEKTRVKMNLSARIADELSKKGMSQKDLAVKMNKSPSEISKWLSGTHNFTTDTLVEICSTLQMDIRLLFEDKNRLQTIRTYNVVLQSQVDPKVKTQVYPVYSHKEKSSIGSHRMELDQQIYHWNN